MPNRRPALTAVLLACAAWLTLHELRVVAFHGFEFGPLSSRFAHDVVLLIAAGVCLARGATVRRERAAWLLIGAGVLAWTLGEIYYTAVLWTDNAPPIPSPADIGYLLFPVLVFAGMLALLRSRARVSATLLVDGIAAALAVSALSAAIVFQTVLEHVDGELVAVATSLAYPLTDLILLAIGVGALAGTGWRLDRTWALLAAGVLAFWFADSMYLVRTAEGTYESGGWFDAGWWAAAVLIATAAWQKPPTTRRRCADDSLRLIAAPLVSGAVGLELLLYGSTGDLNLLAVGLSAASLVFVMIRLTLTFRQNVKMLRASRDEALTDALTGLGNRRALVRALDEALADARAEDPLVLALFDLDGFKHYNDTFGHPAGDVLLTRLGGRLSAYFGTRARVFRMGGDEFCALFEPTGADLPTLLDGAALALSEQGEDYWIGCSYGAVTLPRETADASEALRIADQRMYAQKHAGRLSAARQVKEALVAALDPALEARSRVAAELAEAAARRLGLGRDEREAIRLAAELHEVGTLAEGGARAGARIVGAAPSLAATARLIGAINEPWESIPLGARIVAAAAFTAAHPGAGLDSRFDPAVAAALNAPALA
ncbi:MAG TPA: GGDEF domain-containing protein [Solirubrobacter sp.]|nr:GGDEF domain-containing protein [Solirubrobacter sp.]